MGRQAEVIEVKGSVELAPLVGLADGIVDLVDTGRTLAENGLEVVEEISVCTARLVANRVAHKLRAAEIDAMVERLRGGGGGMRIETSRLGSAATPIASPPRCAPPLRGRPGSRQRWRRRSSGSAPAATPPSRELGEALRRIAAEPLRDRRRADPIGAAEIAAGLRDGDRGAAPRTSARSPPPRSRR